VNEAFTKTLQWWKDNALERNMVPTYLDGTPIHRGVWKGQGVDQSEEGHKRRDATSLTDGNVTVMTSDACTDAGRWYRPSWTTSTVAL
jgi:hypothetical protein